MVRPIVLQLGDDVRWNLDLYAELQTRFDIRRSYSMPRPEFVAALKSAHFGDFVAIYRPFWSTGGEMGRWDRDLVSLLPTSCEIYASAGAGFDWVDTEALAKRGIIYCNAAPACTEAVADAAIWLMLSTYRLFSWSAMAARTTNEKAFVTATNSIGSIGKNPNGSLLGIVGFGRIGRRIAEKAHDAFAMRIGYNDLVRMPEADELRTEATYYESLPDLLKSADCVLLAAPFKGATLFDKTTIDMIKPKARLVNIARGKLVDESALIAALESGHLCAAGIDVHYNEPQVNPKLAALDNVELTAHTAGASLDSHIGFERLGMQNILEYFQSGQAITPVNLQWLEKNDVSVRSRQ